MEATSDGITDLHRLNAQRFRTLAVGVWGMICAGSIYAFGLWSETFASNVWYEETNATMHIDTQLSTLYQWTLTGVYVPFSGLLYHKFGTKAMLVGGAVLMTSGYFIVYLANQRMIGLDNWLVLCFGFFSIGHGAGYVDVAVMGSNLKNFRAFRGSAAGFLKGYFGLSASIVAFVYACSQYFRDRILFMLGVSSGVLIMLGAVLSIDLPARESKSGAQAMAAVAGKTRKTLALGYTVEVTVTLILLLFATVGSITAWDPSGIVGDVLVLAMLFCICFGSFGLWAASLRNRHEPTVKEERDMDEERSSLQKKSVEGDVTVEVSKPIWASLCSRDFLCMFVALFVGTGAGLTIISNASRICLAKGDDMEQSTDLFVAVLSVWNCIGRLASGWVSDQERLVSAGFSRVRLLVLTGFVMLIGHSCLYFAETVALTFIAATLIGLAYGSYWTLYPTLLIDLFGEENFGIHIAVMQLAPALGSLVFSRLVSTWFYEAHVDEGQSFCVGNQCFGGTHLVIVVCLFISMGFSLSLVFRTEQRTRNTI